MSSSSSSSTENSNKDSTNTTQSTPAPAQNTDNYYQRQKKWISGVDNDMVLGVGVAVATTIASIAAFPMIKDAWERFVNRPPAPPAIAPPTVEEYIPPTQPNGHAAPQEQQPVEETPPPPPVVEPPKEEEEPDGLFHEAELRRKQKMMGQRPRGNRYESPFGKDIGGL